MRTRVYVRVEDVRPLAEAYYERYKTGEVDVKHVAKTHGLCDRWLRSMAGSRRYNSRGNRTTHASFDLMDRLAISLDMQHVMHGVQMYAYGTNAGYYPIDSDEA